MHTPEKIAELQADLARARAAHFRLVWLAGGTAAARSALLRALSEAEDGVFVELGKKLSTALIDIPAPFRTASVEDCFAACMGESTSETTCLDHLEILFEPSLLINPVALIQGASRHAVIVAAWPGVVEGSRLTFGSPDHPGYKEIQEQDLEAVVHSI